MSNDGDYVERTTDTPSGVRREEVRVIKSSGMGGWWVALAIVAVVVIGAFAWFAANQNNQADLQAARDQGAVEANLANAASNAQSAASQAAQSAQSAATNSVQATEGAARAGAQRATGAADAARDAAASEPSPPSQPPPQ